MPDLLSTIRGPRDLDNFSRAQLDTLASNIREFLVAAVSRAGGYLGPNLGVVELTIALQRVFESPRDIIVFDVGQGKAASWRLGTVTSRLRCHHLCRGEPR